MDQMKNTPGHLYRDLPFRIIISLIAAHLIVSLGESESCSKCCSPGITIDLCFIASL